MRYAPAKPSILKGHSGYVITTSSEFLVSLFWFCYIKLLRFIKMTRDCTGDPVLLLENGTKGDSFSLENSLTKISFHFLVINAKFASLNIFLNMFYYIKF